tara:strand:+ start:1048 stop:1857 length:810 start_codon:yes stop_codon:yes gene_type:complete
MIEDIEFLIIIPTYNSYKDLRKFTSSIKSQSHQKWRTVFVDGDSTENHKDWLKSCVEKDRRFIFIDEEKDRKGIYPSMSLGAQYAKNNEWIIFLGSDDCFSSSESLSQISSNLKKYKKDKFKLVICGTQFINKNTNQILRVNKLPSLKFIDNKKLEKLVFFGFMPAHQSLCFSADLLENLMPYSNNYFLAADSRLVFKMLTLNYFKILFINKIHINIRSGGISSKYLFKRIKEVLFIYLRFYKVNFFVPFTLRYLKKILSRIKYFYIKI